MKYVGAFVSQVQNSYERHYDPISDLAITLTYKSAILPA